MASSDVLGPLLRSGRSTWKVSAIRRNPILVALVAAVLFPASVKADAGCSSSRCRERVHRKACDQAHPRHCVERAILTYRLTGWRASWMRRIPSCESGYNPRAHNPEGASGLYQFLPSTWVSATPYGRHSIWSAKWQSLAAAYLIRRDQQGQWVCR